MSEELVVQAIENLINSNISTLLSGLNSQGTERDEYQVVGTSLAPAQLYYFISIDINRVRYSSRSEGVPTQAAPQLRTAEYDCVIGVTDAASLEVNDPEPYRLMHKAFRKFSDRVVALFEDQNLRWLNAPGNVAKYELKRSSGRTVGGSDRAVEKNNLSGTYIDQEQEYSLLHSQITFTLVDHCHDTSLLYD